MDGIYVAGNHCDDRSIGPAIAIPLRTCCGHQKQLSSAWLVYVYVIVTLWCYEHSSAWEGREYNSHTHVCSLHATIIFIGSELEKTHCFWYCPTDMVFIRHPLPTQSCPLSSLSSTLVPYPMLTAEFFASRPPWGQFPLYVQEWSFWFPYSPDLIKASSQDHFGLDPHFSHSLNLCVI